MRSKLLIAIAAVVCFTYQAQATVIFGPLINPANNHAYVLLSQNNWTASEAEALSLGGHLATVRSAAENQFLISNFASFSGSPRGLWIGLNDAAIEGTRVWTSGETSSYTNWAPNEPSNSTVGSDYVLIYAPNVVPAGKWDDGEDATSWGYQGVPHPMHGVVEFIPEPASLSMVLSAAIGIAIRRRPRYE